MSTSQVPDGSEPSVLGQLPCDQEIATITVTAE